MDATRIRWLRWLAVALVLAAAGLCSSRSMGLEPAQPAPLNLDWAVATYEVETAVDLSTYLLPIPSAEREHHWQHIPAGTTNAALFSGRGLPAYALGIWIDRFHTRSLLDGEQAQLSRVAAVFLGPPWHLAVGLRPNSWQGGAPGAFAGLGASW